MDALAARPERLVELADVLGSDKVDQALGPAAAARLVCAGISDLERITARRSELDALAEELAKS